MLSLHKPYRYLSLVANYVFKILVEVLCTPLTYWIVAKLKKEEQEDYYLATDFNPFKLK